MNPLLFKVLAFLFPLQWGTRYSRVDKSPTHFEFTLLMRLGQIKHLFLGGERRRPFLSYQQSESYRRLLRRFTAFSVPSRDMSDDETTELPAVRLLWVAHEKDFEVLPHSVLGALRHVKNPITGIDFVSPSPGEAKNLLTPFLPPEINAQYLSDADIVPGSLREALSRSLATHGGWATQQLIKILMAMRNDSECTLVIDSDTVLIRDKTWLTPEGRQLLYFRGFTNPRYQQYLARWGLEEIDTMKSFVTHHMLFQPSILKPAIERIFGSTSPAAIVETIVSSKKQLGFPEFSLDYELYGNVVWSEYPRCYRLDKYSNIGLARPGSFEKLASQLMKMRKTGRYNSASFHNPDR